MQTWLMDALLALATSGPDSQNDSFELSFSDLTLVLESGQIIVPKQRGERGRRSESQQRTILTLLQIVKRTDKNVATPNSHICSHNMIFLLNICTTSLANFISLFPFSSIRLIQHMHYQPDK